MRDMQALILAAGKGDRLSNHFSPKPLIPIFGLPLLERIILTAKLAGIRDFKVVVGYKAEQIKKEMGNGEKLGVHIEYIFNPEWEKGNGVSVLKAKGSVQGKFLLLMSDHLFDQSILKELLQTKLENDSCILCVDRDLRGTHFSIDDATKVKIGQGKVTSIGKELTDYDAIDTGIFLCTPVLFDALEKIVSRSKCSLSAVNRLLAERGRLNVLDVTGHFWVDVDDNNALRKAQDILIHNLLKPTDGPISKVVNRRFSIRISAYLARYNISPNSLTLISFGLAILSALFFFLGGYGKMVIAGIAAQLSSIVDGCDGEIARLKFKSSSFGEWFDRILDRYADGLIILGMTHAAWLSTTNGLVWLAGFFALIGTFMNSYTAIPYDQILQTNLLPHRAMRLGRDVRLFVVFLGALFNQLLFTLIILAVVTNFEILRRLIVLRHEYQFDARH